MQQQVADDGLKDECGDYDAPHGFVQLQPPAIEAAFCKADRVTFAGSMTSPRSCCFAICLLSSMGNIVTGRASCRCSQLTSASGSPLLS